jgi:putative ABC transport system ATP-binding protein
MHDVSKPRPTKRKAPARNARPARRARSAEAELPILAARDLVKEYKTNGSATRALDGVSLDVARGAFLSVMGPSGSGKSTLMHLLGGLDGPTSGDVFLEGKPLSGLSDKDITLARRGSVGFVFQFFNLVPVLTVAENVALPLVIAGERPDSYKARLDAVIDQVGLRDCAEKLPSQISGGQQQRTAIARAIFPSPLVVLADEPTGNLDTRTGQQILQLLKDLQTDHGQTIVIVTHDARAAAYGDRVIYLEDGAIRSRIDLSKTRTSKNGARTSQRSGDARGGERRAQAVLSWLQELGA